MFAVIHLLWKGTDNGCEFLRGEIEEKDLKIKKKFQDDIPYTDKWWKKKAIKRYKNMYDQSRIKPETLFYWDVIDISWEEIKEKAVKSIAPSLVYEEGDLIKRAKIFSKKSIS